MPEPSVRFADAPPSAADLAIIGGGIVGCATAFFAARAELLSGDEVRARWPWVSAEVRGARYRDGDGWLDPKRLTAGYATAASHAERIPGASPGGGATFVTRAGVTAIRTDGDRIQGVSTTRGELATDR